MSEWKLTRYADENVVYETKIHDIGGNRNHRKLKRVGRLWYYPDGSMYVYYTPTHFKEIEQ